MTSGPIVITKRPKRIGFQRPGYLRGFRGLAPEPGATAGRAGLAGQLNDIFLSRISTFIRSNALIPSSGSGIGRLTSIASTLLKTQEPISSRFSKKNVIGYLVPSTVDAVDVTDDDFNPPPSPVKAG